jgi:hypothetical protein
MNIFSYYSVVASKTIRIDKPYQVSINTKDMDNDDIYIGISDRYVLDRNSSSVQKISLSGTETKQIFLDVSSFLRHFFIRIFNK